MHILGYGEDALTLWALKNRLDVILRALEDASPTKSCKVFFRPSFGRRGGSRSSQFGEFDFLLLARDCLYLGESKWTGSSEKVKRGNLELSPVQLLRHRLFRFYVEQWAFGGYSSWNQFRRQARSKLRERGIAKPLAPTGSLLAQNLQFVLGVITEHYRSSLPEITNVLLYLHRGELDEIPRTAGAGFIVVPLDYSEAAKGNYVVL